MLNYIWGFMMIISFLCAIATGRMNELSCSIMDGASSAINLVISLMGMMCFFSGLMKIADLSGITKMISRVLAPVISKLFPDYDKDSKSFAYICMNITANLIGLGNAATPLGIKAMEEMSKNNKYKDKANNSMVMFVVLNTASIQLVPTMMATLRQKHGALSAFDVLPAIWITSFTALVVGISVTKILGRMEK